jgi:hypothetical protein
MGRLPVPDTLRADTVGSMTPDLDSSLKPFPVSRNHTKTKIKMPYYGPWHKFYLFIHMVFRRYPLLSNSR